MGCDIHTQAEKLVDGKWQVVGAHDEFLSDRNYRVFAFLANVRNGEGVDEISEPRGLPKGYVSDENNEDWYMGDHSYSWLSVQELVDFEYDQIAVEGQTYKQFLSDYGCDFFAQLDRLQMSGADRIVFGFDS